MATVMVTIDGKTYRMACDEGQEEHLAGLAARLDRYISHLKSSFGEIGDHRLSVMAGIMVMDEMTEIEKRVEYLEDQNAQLTAEQENTSSNISQQEQAFITLIDEAAKRIEGLAMRIAPTK
ncbi:MULTISPECIES: cell division protein ZapA [unclassified Bartonella]|uniref:cell division protein ZapA n=1 Tax=unclassified Bartonella TaxID=2645622 RepID=UPI0015F78A87|nr:MULTISPECIES: cell division protein ZapA [unclassified Bartonella]UXN03663.1 cell division protein ZapA [Bartonella sp. HY406]